MASLKKVGYIGSPGNLEDLNIKGAICEVLSGLASRGFEVYVGKPNAALSTGTPVKFEDMQTADVEMFDAVIVTPGGPAAGNEANRFNGHATLFTFINSASERGRPEWFGKLSPEATFDLKDMQAGLVVEAIMKSSGQSSTTVGNSKPASALHANHVESLPLTSNFGSSATVARLKKVGYIGSPGNLDDLKIKGAICEVLSGLASQGFQVYVGKPNAVLSTGAPVKFEDMQTADVEMFDAVIVTPGGPAAGNEANRFNDHAALFTFINSASERGRPEWFSKLSPGATFDLNNMQAGLVVEAIMKSSEQSSTTVGNSKPASALHANPAESLPLTSNFGSSATVARLKKIAYIGSPGNLDDLKIKGAICEVLSGLASQGFEVYVGKPNAVLSTGAPVKFEDMQTADVDMFDAVIVTPGGPAAGNEANRFNGHATLFTFINSANERGRPEWFGKLSPEATFDLKDMQAGLVVEAIMKSSEQSSTTVGNSKPACALHTNVQDSLVAYSSRQHLNHVLGLALTVIGTLIPLAWLNRRFRHK